jgi:hypothetical protein
LGNPSPWPVIRFSTSTPSPPSSSTPPVNPVLRHARNSVPHSQSARAWAYPRVDSVEPWVQGQGGQSTSGGGGRASPSRERRAPPSA